MFTSAHTNRSAQASASTSHYAHHSDEQTANGLIGGIVYREDQPMVTQLLLLPLLQQLGQQSRWQLWLAPRQKLSREQVQSAGPPLSKVIQISQLSPYHTVNSMIRALYTDNYSVVICWLAEELTIEKHEHLVNAAQKGCAIGFIVRPVRSQDTLGRQLSGLKIHSNLYHWVKLGLFLKFFLPMVKTQRSSGTLSRNACHTRISTFFLCTKINHIH